MLIISLIVSAVMLVVANRSVRRSGAPTLSIGCMGLACVIGPFFMLCALPTVGIQSLLMFAAVIVWQYTRRDAATFLRLSLGATALAYAVGGVLAYRSMQEYAQLRRDYPFESMETRVPEPRIRASSAPLPAATMRRLYVLDEKIPDRVTGLSGAELRMLHDQAVGLFINSPGFGIARMFLPNRSTLELFRPSGPIPEQPGPPIEQEWSPGEWRSPAEEQQGPLGDFLVDSIEQFADPVGFGYVKDRRHVAGFQPHRFHWHASGLRDVWKLRRLELVGLLLHDKPAVYISDHLPAMTRTHDVPTRPLDRVERAGLRTLKRGEDLFFAQVGDYLRMVGAVRAATACVRCHGGSRGDLLGAFSYTLEAVHPTRK